LALELARRVGGEILSADMGQLYRRLAAGTAKPEPSEVPYHLIDVLDPAEASDAGSYARLARPVLEDALGRGKVPIVAGGTGLYVRALLEGLDELPKADPALRKRLEARGPSALRAELERADPAAAAKIPAGQLPRVLRALEVLELTGRPISSFWSRPRAAERVAYLGLDWTPEALRGRIRERAEAMFPRMIAEVRALVPSPLTGEEPAFRCLGYPQALACARGELSQGEGLAAMIAATNAYARRQRTWFRNQTPTSWLSPEADADEALRRIGWSA